MNVNNNIQVDIQIKSDQENIPSKKELIEWTKAALERRMAEITICIVDEDESAYLNKTYRNKKGSTNVLSFPLSSLHDDTILLGDIVICAPIASKEANAQHISVKAHWAHLVVHGTLHLQGFDHIKEDDAKIMEAKEVLLLSALGFSNPYV